MTGRIEPTIAPIVNWPSAPMFQLLDRKQTDSPTAIRMSGAALTANSCNCHRLFSSHKPVSGSMK
jgi:hypothetical protein